MDDTQYAWAAGFWDGEGCVSLTYRQFSENTPKIPRITVQVAQVDREVLDRFCTIMEFGKVLGPYTQKNKNAQPYYVWRVEGVLHLDSMRKKLTPHLGKVKMKQINDALYARKLWEETAKCFVHDTRLEVTSRGTWRCRKCLSDAGKKRVAARWGER